MCVFYLLLHDDFCVLIVSMLCYDFILGNLAKIEIDKKKLLKAFEAALAKHGVAKLFKVSNLAKKHMQCYVS